MSRKFTVHGVLRQEYWSMSALTWWTWVWVDSRSWWWTGRPGVLRFMGSQRVRHDWATELNWTELNWTEKAYMWNHGFNSLFNFLCKTTHILYFFPSQFEKMHFWEICPLKNKKRNVSIKCLTSRNRPVHYIFSLLSILEYVMMFCWKKSWFGNFLSS